MAWATAQTRCPLPAASPVRVVENGVVLCPCAVTGRVCTTVPFTVMSTLSSVESMVSPTTLRQGIEGRDHQARAAGRALADGRWRLALQPAPAMAKALITMLPTPETGSVVPSPSVTSTMTSWATCPARQHVAGPGDADVELVPPEEVNALRSLVNAAGATSGTVCVPGNATTPTFAIGDRVLLNEAITLCVVAFSQLEHGAAGEAARGPRCYRTCRGRTRDPCP